AKHVRSGDERRSPWPFRVAARTNIPREEYSSNVVGALMLFDELDRLGLGDVDAYRHARAIALSWLLRVPMKNDAWSGYFEDIDIHLDPAENPNQYSALRTARWLMLHPGDDPAWRDHVSHLLSWTERVFGGDTATERGTQWGATVLSEQADDTVKMGSHTARFGATSALWFRVTGNVRAREQAARSLNWATYMCRADGVVSVGEDANEGWWFSDGYGDYIRHFLVAMAAVPDWAPAREDHLLSSTSVVRAIRYTPAQIAWTTFDADAVETLRLVDRPRSVAASGHNLAEMSPKRGLIGEGFTIEDLAGGGVLLRVRHRTRGEVVVTLKGRALSKRR
ncbi:MAG: hypothetical protein ACREJ3_08225, partial [Polyangiaceae bacterium]